ncbi:MAG: hypothetical protein LUE87_11330 [Lachnospiraceae bacterium]|nr:hypothetical protein [Lachnospiraceae bacterium]
MARQKQQKSGGTTPKSAAEYYKLNTKAVDDLVDADESNSPEVSEEELSKYRSVSKFKPKEWMKALFIKFWFPAAVCYCFFWGLGTYVSDMLDMLFITAIALGIITDLLTNNMLRFIAKSDGANDRWMMFPKKGYYSFPANILYGAVVLAMVVTIYNMINMAFVLVTGITDTTFLGVEPILFGVFYVLCDSLLVEFKHLCVRIVKDAMRKEKRANAS